jgi:hypothetical protein
VSACFGYPLFLTLTPCCASLILDFDFSEANVAAVSVMAVLPASLLLLLLGLVTVSTYDWKTGAVPFTIEEWIWATKGGYLHTMIDHYIRNAGL